MNRDFDQILDECLDRLNKGESIEECLKLYPELASELEPLLRTTNGIQRQTVFVPSADSKEKGRARLRQEMARISQNQSKPVHSFTRRLWAQPKAWVPAAAGIMLAIIILSVWAISGFGPTEVAYAGTIEIRVTDAPNYDVSAVYVTISNIEVRRGGIDGEVGTSSDIEKQGWFTIIGEERKFELLKLRGVEEVLGSKQLEAGQYTQIRMNVEDVIVTIDGTPQDAVLPSGKLKIIGSFSIEEGKTTALTLDFDAAKSVVVTGQGKVHFKPVVKLMVAQR